MKSLFSILAAMILMASVTYAETVCATGQYWNTNLNQCVTANQATDEQITAIVNKKANAEYDAINHTPRGNLKADGTLNTDFKNAYESTNANSNVNSVVT